MKSETVTAKKSTVLKALVDTTDVKEFAVKVFGKGILPPVKKPITERIKSYENACKEIGVHPVKSLPYPKPKTDNEKSINAYAKLRIINAALNEGWKPNWEDSSEYKYIPWFNMPKKSGVGFSDCDYGDWGTNSIVGSRLCFKSKELCIYAAKQFLPIYQDYFTL